MFSTQYLSAAQLAGFDNYKYNAVDTNPLSKYVMHPFWNQVVKICPKTVAPNVLTFSGFLFTVVNFILLCIYDYQFYASTDEKNDYPPIPRWVWLVSAINLFLAHTLDGIDGKQARRTGTSGPLGELFDHGLDSWTTVLIPAGLFSVFGRGSFSISIIRMYACLWAVFFNFFVSHWEKYNTGVLFLPWGYDTSLLIAEIIYLITYFGGHELWKFYIFGKSISSGATFEFLLWLASLGTAIPMAVYNLYKSYKEKTGKMYGFCEANRPFVSLLTLLTLCLLWAIFSPGKVIERDPRCFFFMSGTIFSNICCRLIVSQMSNSRCSLFNMLLIPTALCTAVSLFLPVDNTAEVYMLYVLTVIATSAHLHYGICVVRQMCQHFHIECFTIKRQGED